MKKILCLAGYSLLVICLVGCASLKSVLWPGRGAGKAAKAKIAVADFDIKTAKADRAAASELRQILITEFINNGRFKVAERQAQGAGLIITAAVTEFEPQVSGGRGGVGGGGGASSGRLGGLLGASLSKARISLDIRIVNASTSETLAASSVQGQASDMEKAIHICIIEAVRYISKAIPETYYKD
jgi:curli biogenesis system outer membrane secretion channel CsgG